MAHSPGDVLSEKFNNIAAKYRSDGVQQPVVTVVDPESTVVDDDISSHWPSYPQYGRPESGYVQPTDEPPAHEAQEEYVQADGHSEYQEDDEQARDYSWVKDGSRRGKPVSSYIERLMQGVCSPSLLGALVVSLIIHKTTLFSSLLYTVVATSYPLLLLVYLWSFRDRPLTLTAICSISTIAVSPLGMVFGSELLSLLLIVASYPITCIDGQRTMRRPQQMHGWWAAFCLGVVVFGLK